MNKLLGFGLAIAAFAASAVSVMAAAPVADTGVATATTDLVTGLQTTGVAGLTSLLPIAGVLVVTVALVFFVIGHFRAITHI